MSLNILEIIRGDTYEIPVSFKNANGSAYDLTGCTVYFTVKALSVLDESNDDNAIIAKEYSSGLDTSGVVTLILSTTDTNQTSGDYVWDLQIKTADDEIISSQRGKMKIVYDVTRRTS